MSRCRLEAHYLDSASGRIFALLRAAPRATRSVLFVPPFGEEMNKARRQVSLVSQALTDRGLAALVVDLFGTGDSHGEFVDGAWDVWKNDLAQAITWSADAGLEVDAVVATRLGCLLAADALKSADHSVNRSVFWQPVDSGRGYMTQFLRLRVAASMMESDANETVDGLRERLAAGEALEVAGYTLSPALFQAIDSVNLPPLLGRRLGRLAIFEVGRTKDGSLSVAGRRLKSAAQELGVATIGCRVAGDPFWSATEIVVNPELTALTSDFLAEPLAP